MKRAQRGYRDGGRSDEDGAQRRDGGAGTKEGEQKIWNKRNKNSTEKERGQRNRLQ